MLNYIETAPGLLFRLLSVYRYADDGIGRRVLPLRNGQLRRGCAVSTEIREESVMVAYVQHRNE